MAIIIFLRITAAIKKYYGKTALELLYVRFPPNITQDKIEGIAYFICQIPRSDTLNFTVDKNG
jgi:hypothetical protein